MPRIVRYAILAVAMSVGLTVHMAQPASAQTGDYLVTGCGKVDGGPYGVSCDTYMKTNKCTGGVVSWRLLWAYPQAGPDADQLVVFHNGSTGCNLKLRHRVKYGTQSPQWLSTVYVAANDEGWVGQQPRNRNLCWTDFYVQRKDGTWLTHRHYSPKWGREATWRAACRTDQ